MAAQYQCTQRQRKRIAMTPRAFVMLPLPIAGVLVLALVSAANAQASPAATTPEEDLRVASKKMDELMAAAAQLPKSGYGFDPIGDRVFGNRRSGGDFRWRADSQLSNIKRNYEMMSRNNAASAAQWYRSQVEGKTIYDFAGPEARPEFLAVADAVQAEMMRIHESMPHGELHFTNSSAPRSC